MRTFSGFVSAVIAAAASSATAQATPQSHEQHQAAGQHQATGKHEVAKGSEKCCCEEMMREMHKMMEMMQHQGMGMNMPKALPEPQKPKP